MIVKVQRRCHVAEDHILQKAGEVFIIGGTPYIGRRGDGLSRRGADMCISDPVHWYTLVLQTEKETSAERVGICAVRVDKCVVKLDGQSIKFRGVNRNEPISDNQDFIEPTLNRIRCLVCRDRNRPCVLIWPMGNEWAYGCTFEEAIK